jgi:hypothetical protein
MLDRRGRRVALSNLRAAFGDEISRKEWGSVLTFDTGDARTSPDRLPQDFAKFFSSRYHVTFCRAGDADQVKR